MYILLEVWYPEVQIKECKFVMKMFSGMVKTWFLNQKALSSSALILDTYLCQEIGRVALLWIYGEMMLTSICES